MNLKVRDKLYFRRLGSVKRKGDRIIKVEAEGKRENSKKDLFYFRSGRRSSRQELGEIAHLTKNNPR